LIFWKRFLETNVTKVILFAFLRLAAHSKINLVMNTAVKKEQTIPIIKVTANPFTPPEPNMYKITPVKKVVALESIIEL
jgi:hypothetical protein